jgi:hypothetical protein
MGCGDIMTMPLALNTWIMKLKSSFGVQRMTLQSLNMFIITIKCIYRMILKYIYSAELFRKHQVRYVRRQHDLSRKTIIPPELLYELISIKKQHYSKLMGIRRLMYHIRTHCRIWVNRHIVHEALKVVDPEGLEERRARRLQRRIFHCQGRDQVWSLDGHDKLKRWGFPIHGCCDVYSRYSIWLRVGVSNNDPRFILSYYLDALEEENKDQNSISRNFQAYLN